MKKTTLILAALVASASLSAQTAPVAAPAAAPAPAPVVAPAAPAYSVTVDFPYTTKYVFRGIELAQESFQPSVKAAFGSAYVGLWTNQPVTSNVDNEIDFYAGYGFKLSDTWSLDVGLTAYYYPELDASAGLDRSTYEGYVGLNGAFGSASVGAYAYYDMTLKAFTLQGTAGYNFAINDKASVNFLATLGNVSPDAGDSYTYYGLGVTLPYKLTDAATVTAGLQYASHTLDMVDDSHVWGTIGVTVTF